MTSGFFKILLKSLRFHRKAAAYQFLITALLAAVITGSLLTGWSVRESLRRNAVSRIGNTGIVISSGSRYFKSALAGRLSSESKLESTGILELQGFCQNFLTQETSRGIKIYGITASFAGITGNTAIRPGKGEAVINQKLATDLGLNTGDELILRFREINAIPASAPFAPAADQAKSAVFRITAIITPGDGGTFSLSITQAVTGSVFVNIDDIDPEGRMNRILVSAGAGKSTGEAGAILKSTLKLSDIGFNLVRSEKAGDFELRSDRIFIDEAQLEDIRSLVPGAKPLITYLGNSFTKGDRSTPYSFVSALPGSLYPGAPCGSDIIISRWLADDLKAAPGDSITMKWYSPDSLSKLAEQSGRFRVSAIAGENGIWADSLLMPDFPGISGSESCSSWDAGVPISLGEIRPKDEEYWKLHRGTPKAFIGYMKGVAIWGSNFGPATALRFPPDMDAASIKEKLDGRLEPSRNGFLVSDLRGASIKAASESVDFGSLFLSLGFFLLIASFVLLYFAVSAYLRTKEKDLRIYFSLGFSSSWIRMMFFSETAIIAVLGSLAGAFSGTLVNLAIIRMLNTVWTGAVQTDALSALVSVAPILTGFISTLAALLIFLRIAVGRYLDKLKRPGTNINRPGKGRNKLLILLPAASISIALLVLSFINTEHELIFGFSSGAFLFLTFILLWNKLLSGNASIISAGANSTSTLSRAYYSQHPSAALTPVLFIAAGVFSVIITGVNRLETDEKDLRPGGGTGGYLLWCETAVPVTSDLSTLAGREKEGLGDEDVPSSLRLVQLPRYLGDDASCLNLNHVSVPPLLGVDPGEFISGGSFSFARSLKKDGLVNSWNFLSGGPSAGTIYGIADQTVLEWGLGLKTGDTLSLKAENGQRLNIIIAAGLKSSVFQGYLIIGKENFRKYFPSVEGSSVILAGGESRMISRYSELLKERLGSYGIEAELTTDRLAAFNQVTNTYLDVFGVFGGLGMIAGVAGLGFVLLRNYYERRKEFALMLATGFSFGRIRNMILGEQLLILSAGIITGILPAIAATLASLRNNTGLPWFTLAIMLILIFLSGLSALLFSFRPVRQESLITALRKE